LSVSNRHENSIREQWIMGTELGYIEYLFNYRSVVRKIRYTANAIESVNSSFCKVTKKDSFSSEEAVMKTLYLWII